MCGYPCSSLISDCVRLRTFVWICRGFNVGAGWRAIAIDIYTTRYDVAACQPMPISQTPPAPNVGAGLPAIALGINTTLQAVAANANHDAKRAALDLDLLLILGAPLNHAGRNSTGIWGVNRQGCRFSRPAPWMARGGGPPNHWRITGTPSPSEVPSGGARAFCLLCRSCKVSRRQGGTLCGRYRSNGYVHNPTVLTVSPPSRASPLPQVDRGVSVSRCRLAGRHRRQASSHIWSAERLAVITAMRQPDKPAPTEDFCIL
ncbi:hypothetical protein SAMN03159316_5198 [Pseudomonas sp. NFR02]|nr:hypothetical protein SAMN03159316_5198 [Pseudomonas sp. NFR02]